MKYAIIALLLIGLSVKGQDSVLHLYKRDSSSSQFLFSTASSQFPTQSFSAELLVYDSLKLIGYQKKDSTLVIIGDSARFIRVILESMAYYSKFKVRFPKQVGHDKIILYGSDMDTFRLTNPTMKKKKRYHGELVMASSGGVRWADPLVQKTTISGASSFSLTFDSGATSRQLVFPVEAKNHWITEPYSWWKKALWVLLGMVIITVAVFFVALFGEAKKD